MTKTLKNSLVALFILFICTACPYQSAVPISEAIVPVEENLLGKWRSDANDKKEYIEIKKKDGTHYLIVQHTFNEDLQAFEKNEMSGHLSKINDSLYINLLQRNGFYHPYKVQKISPKMVRLYPLSDHIKEQFTKSGELQAYIAKYQHLSFFFGNEMEMVKE